MEFLCLDKSSYFHNYHFVCVVRACVKGNISLYRRVSGGSIIERDSRVSGDKFFRDKERAYKEIHSSIEFLPLLESRVTLWLLIL